MPKVSTKQYYEIEEDLEIEFVSYNGKYPNLCSGVLTVNINGTNVDFENILASGGTCSVNYGTSRGEWKIDNNHEQVIEFGDIYGCYEFERKMLEVINDNITYGCCGGCI